MVVVVVGWWRLSTRGSGNCSGIFVPSMRFDWRLHEKFPLQQGFLHLNHSLRTSRGPGPRESNPQPPSLSNNHSDTWRFAGLLKSPETTPSSFLSEKRVLGKHSPGRPWRALDIYRADISYMCTVKRKWEQSLQSFSLKCSVWRTQPRECIFRCGSKVFFYVLLRFVYFQCSR